MAEPVVRVRLLEPLCAARVGLVQAPGGWGKSTLVAQLAARLRPSGAVAVVAVAPTVVGFRADLAAVLHRCGLTDLAELVRTAPLDRLAAGFAGYAAGSPDELTLVWDDVHAADDDTVTLLAELVELDVARIVVVGRHLPERLARAAELLRAAGVALVDMGAAHLALDADETAALLAARDLTGDGGGAGVLPGRWTGVAATLVDAANGWPAAVDMAVRLVAQGAEHHTVASQLAAGTGSIRALIATVLDRLSPADRAVARQLALLPTFDSVIAEQLAGADAVERLRIAGVPVTVDDAGWLSFAGPFQEALRRRQIRLSPKVARTVANRYLDRDEWGLAVDALMLAGLVEQAAGAAERLQLGGLDAMPVDPLAGVVALLPPPRWAAHLGLLAAYATALEQSGALPQRGAFLGRAALHIADDPVARRWVRAEQIYDGAREGNLPIATIEREARELLTEVSPSEVWTHLRLLEALGKVLAQHDDPASLAEAQQRLRSAVSLAQAQQQPRVAIRVLQTLAYHLGVARGRYGVADDAFIEALAIAQRPSALRCRLIGYRADVLLAAGQVSRALAVLDEYDDVKALATARDAATVEWSRALALTTLGAVDDADHAAAQVYSSVLMQQYLGVWFMAELAMAQARVGRLAQAAATLAPALPRRDELPTYVGMAELAVRCRAEQLTEADLEQLRPVAAAVLAGEDLEARDRFRPHLFLAAALRTLGRADEARAEAITATTLAESVDASLLVRGEPDLARLLEMARDGGQRGGAEDHAASDSWEVSALGPLQIVRNGRLVAVPEGMPMRLVALLALHDDALPIERAAELLWPDSGTLGRRRLRNVLSRLRSAAGPLVVRVGSSLTLDKHADTDVRRLLRYAESAPSEAARLWRAAPLDDNPAYRDLWRVPAAAYLASVRRLAEAAEAVGDIDQAVRWLSRGAEVAPEDASWLVHATRTQAAAGRLGSARATARRLARQVEGTPLRLPDDVARLATMRGR